MVTSEKHQKSLLGGIERHVGLAHPDLIPAVPKILMALYQIDVLEEDVITQWGTHVSKKYVDKETSKKVRKASEPFLKVRFPLHSTGFASSNLFLCLSGLLKQKTMMMTKMSDHEGQVLLLLFFLCIAVCTDWTQ